MARQYGIVVGRRKRIKEQISVGKELCGEAFGSLFVFSHERFCKLCELMGAKIATSPFVRASSRSDWLAASKQVAFSAFTGAMLPREKLAKPMIALHCQC